jgi:hypothetical protein
MALVYLGLSVSVLEMFLDGGSAAQLTCRISSRCLSFAHDPIPGLSFVSVIVIAASSTADPPLGHGLFISGLVRFFNKDYF